MSVTPEQPRGAPAKLIAKLIADELRPELQAIVDELRHDRNPACWLTAEECADRYWPRRSAKWWREHADEFGAKREGDGPRPRISFDPAEVERVLAERRAA